MPRLPSVARYPTSAAMQKSLLPPRAERRPVSATHHGHTRTDDFAWLRAENWQEVMRNPAALPADIRAYLEAENAYFAAAMADTEALQETLFKEMRGRIKEDDFDRSRARRALGPMPMRYIEGGQHPLYVRERREGGGEEILLDGNALAEGHAYFRIGGAHHSPDHRLLAWSHDDAGSEFYTLSVRDLESGHDLADVIPDTGGSRRLVGRRPASLLRAARREPPPVARLPPQARHGPRGRTCSSTRSRIPASSSASARRSRERFILIHSHDHETSEVRFIPADAPEAEPTLVAPRETAVEYSVDEAHGRFFILTNAGGAKDFRIVTAPVETPGRENWTDLVAARAGPAHPFARRDGAASGAAGARRRACRGSSCAASPTAPSTPSPSTRRPIRSALPAATSSTPTRCASPIPRWRRRRASTTTTWRRASACCGRSRRCPPATIPSLYVTRRIMAPAAGRRDGPDLAPLPQGHEARRLGALPPLRLRRLRHRHAGGFSIDAAVARRPRLRLRRSRMCAAARTRAIAWYEAGQARREGATPSPISSPRPSIWSRERYTSRGRIVARGRLGRRHC